MASWGAAAAPMSTRPCHRPFPGAARLSARFSLRGGHKLARSTAEVGAEAWTRPEATTPPARSSVNGASHAVESPPVRRPSSAVEPPPARRPSSAAEPAPTRRTAATTGSAPAPAPIVLVSKPLARVLLLHTGGTLGMDSHASYEEDSGGHQVLVPGTGGKYHNSRSSSLKPGNMLNNLLSVVPELRQLANLDLKVVFNRDSCNIGPKEWIQLAKVLDANRRDYDAFLVVHGTDTMSYTSTAMSLMLTGFRKPIVFTGSQLPLAMPRSDARQNLIDSLTCATASFNPPHVSLQEVAICFGGRLLRANRARKVHSNVYQAFASPSYPELATMGVDVEWNSRYLLQPEGVYRPRLQLDPSVLRVPIVPGVDPRTAYGDLVSRGVKGIILESFGVGNMPNQHWLPWLRAQRRAGLIVSMVSQCHGGELHPELYATGSAAMALGVEAGPQMTAETAAIKMMLCLAYQDLHLGAPLAGEM